MTLDRDISNASIIVGGASGSALPMKMKARPQTGVKKNLSMRAKRGLMKSSIKVSKNNLMMSSSINIGDSPKLRKNESTATSLLKLNIRHSSRKRGLNSSIGRSSIAENEMLTNLDLRHD